MTCSWCSKPISYFRSLVDSQFCCAEHRKQESLSLRQLALERLQQNSREMEALIGRNAPSDALARSA
jgi:hypothetical protein